MKYSEAKALFHKDIAPTCGKTTHELSEAWLGFIDDLHYVKNLVNLKQFMEWGNPFTEKTDQGMVTLESGDCGTYLLVSDTGADLLIQTDYDFPGVAANLGFVPCEECNLTDGTVDCKHHT